MRSDSGRPDGDDGQEAAGFRTFLAVAEEEVAAAGGAEIADEDVGGEDAGAKELGAIGFAEIEEDVFGRGLVAGGHPVEPLDGIGFVASAEFVEPFGGFGELREELGGDFGADFVAAAADGWADGGEEVGGLGFVLHMHFADGLYDDALQSTAPTRVNSRDSALFRIDEEEGDAVSGLNTEEQAAAVGNGSIALAGFSGCGVEKMDDVGMDLF
jgi:hypothetical protein